MKKSKNILVKLISFVLLITMIGLIPLPAFALVSEDTLWHYEMNDDSTIAILDDDGEAAYTGSEKSISVPETIDGYTVSSIGYNAFLDKGLTEIVIPDTVKGISTSAFTGNDNLVIKGSCGAYAESWADENGFEFESIKHSYVGGGVCISGDDSIDANFSLSLIVSENKINLSWDSIEGAVSFDVYKKCSDQEYILVTNTNENTYIDDITNEGNIYYSVLALDENGECIGCSDTASVFIPKKAAVTLTNTVAGIKISWPEIDGADGYTVYKKENDEYFELATVTDNSYTDSTALSGKKYTYMVETYSGSVKSKSLDVSITFLSSIKPALNNTVSGVKISWTAVSGAKGYYVYRKAAGQASYSVINTTSATSYEDSDVKSGTTYYYAVRAYTGSTKGYYTAATVIFLSSPQLSINTSSAGVKISWDKVKGAQGYYLYRKEAGDSYSIIATLTDNSYLDPASFTAKTYYYAVRAFSGKIKGWYIEEKVKFPPYAGIDVSRYNGNIDFTKAKADGIDFVMIRCGTSYGHSYNKDIRFDENYRNAKKAGLMVGAYFYSYALTTAQAKQEALWCMEMIKGKSFEYPIAFDVEDHTQEKLSVAQLSAIIETFCDTLEANGYKVCVYSSLSWYRSRINENVRESYDVWIAQWYKQCTFPYEYTIWQYTSDGKVNGLSGRVDLDWGYTDYEKVMVQGSYNGYAKNPSAPQMTLTNCIDGIQINWEAVKGAKGYYVYKGSGIGYYSLLATTYDGISYLDTDVKAGTTYKYLIVPINGDSTADYPEKTIVSLSTPTTKLANVSSGSKVTWTKVDGAKGYYIYRKVQGGAYVKIKDITSGTVTSYIDTTAKSGTKYYYAVKAYNGASLSAYNGAELFRLSQTKVSLSNLKDGVSIAWTAVTGADSYNVYRKSGSGSYEKIANVKTLSYIDKTAKSGTKYTYAVRAYNSGYLSSYEGIDILRLDTPNIAVNNKKNGINISWQKVDGAKGYYVYRKTSGSSYSKIATVASSSYLDKTAKAGVKYKYCVKAYNGKYMSEYIGVVSVRLTEPTLKIANTKSGPKLVWTKAASAKGYYVYRKTSTGSYEKIATVKDLTYIDKSAKSGIKYTYAVRAYYSSVRSSYTAVSIKCVK